MDVLVFFMGFCFINKPFKDLNGIFLDYLQSANHSSKKDSKNTSGIHENVVCA